jgi:hypothetical protein
LQYVTITSRNESIALNGDLNVNTYQEMKQPYQTRPIIVIYHPDINAQKPIALKKTREQ